MTEFLALGADGSRTTLAVMPPAAAPSTPSETIAITVLSGCAEAARLDLETRFRIRVTVPRTLAASVPPELRVELRDERGGAKSVVLSALDVLDGPLVYVHAGSTTLPHTGLAFAPGERLTITWGGVRKAILVDWDEEPTAVERPSSKERRTP